MCFENVTLTQEYKRDSKLLCIENMSVFLQKLWNVNLIHISAGSEGFDVLNPNTMYAHFEGNKKLKSNFLQINAYIFLLFVSQENF